MDARFACSLLGLAMVALLGSFSFPVSACAVEDEGIPSSESAALQAAQVDDSASSGSEDPQTSGDSPEPENVEAHDYSNVVNAQVVGDFFFVLCADTVLLVMILGALGFLAFRPSR